MQINADQLRSMMREDAIFLVLGVLILVTGLLTLTLAALLRRRARLLLWLGVFALLYGSRLLIVTELFRLSFDVPEATWEYLAAAASYCVPIPFVLFARAIMPAWRRFWTLGALGLSAFAVYGIASDAFLDRPFSARTPNNVIAIAFFLALLGWIFRPGLTPSRELRTLRIGALAVSLTAMADNLRGLKVLRLSGPELEPLGFAVLIACLATVAVWRVLTDAQRLVVIDQELSVARQIQSSILPQVMPRVPGVAIAARYRPMTTVAGDFYDFVEMDGDSFGILIADVSGHGVPAALIASMVKVAFAAERQHTDSPAAVLAGMNETLCGRLAGRYVTAAYLFVDVQSRVIRYGAAGHPPMLRLARTDRKVDEVERNGLLLGFIEDPDYEEIELPLRDDDRFLLYTDGLIEAANAGEDLFGLERLEQSFAAAAGLPPDAAANALLSAVDAWSGGAPGDDLTLVVVDWTAAKPPAV
jgi:sigma-B regulation protein RsbU (phosphoserine phosphatase)